MRRTPCLLAVALALAATAASAQARATTVARLISHDRSPPELGVHVSNLLDDPDWQEQWGNAFFIQLHWKVQLWQVKLLLDSPQPPIEWDVCVQQVPGLDLFNYTERPAGARITKTFRTLDSLKTWLVGDEGPPVRPLAPGRWYYLVDVHVSTSAEDPCDPRSTPNSGGFLRSLVQGVGPTRDLTTRRLQFTVPER